MSFLPDTAESGNPFPTAFPKVEMSGLIPKYSDAPPMLNLNPVTISSNIRRIPFS
jgi:hypothetical protein